MLNRKPFSKHFAVLLMTAVLSVPLSGFEARAGVKCGAPKKTHHAKKKPAHHNGGNCNGFLACVHVCDGGILGCIFSDRMPAEASPSPSTLSLFAPTEKWNSLLGIVTAESLTQQDTFAVELHRFVGDLESDLQRQGLP